MSYSRQYQTSVHYSGTVHYRYPASEHGGTDSVHYDGDVPITINIDVDTTPFDRSVKDTNTTLAVVAGAVSAAEAAQVAQIQESSNRISNTAVRGFFRMAASEMSALSSEFSNKMSSTVGLLSEQGQQVAHIHNQMEGDYHALKSRYKRVFDELDRELDRRVRELDRPSFQLAEHAEGEVVVRPYQESAARAFVMEQDAGTTPLKLGCARTKSRVLRALDTLGSMCEYAMGYTRAVRTVTEPSMSVGYQCVPVVYAVMRDVQTTGQRIHTYAPEAFSRSELIQRVVTGVTNLDNGQWRNLSASDQAAVDERFMRRLAHYGSAGNGSVSAEQQSRVSQLILDMYKRGRPQTAYR